ncbi:hypothetical protein HQ496_07480 [bacterium]|nr:hypothetical protein [bacterium]
MSFYIMYFSPISTSKRAVTRALGALLSIMMVASLAAGCGTVQHAKSDALITVSGRAVVMGNVPFTALILETKEHNSYILKMDEAMRDSLMTPAQIEVLGELYLAEWNGKPFAHIRVSQLKRID